MKRLLCLLIFFSLVLAACAGSNTPKLIGSAPRETTAGPKLISPPNEVIYNAVMEMEVSDTEKAANRAEELAYRYGGYLASSQLWYEEGKKHTSVVLAVPVPNYENLHHAVSDLGKLTSEAVTGQLVNYAPDGGENTAYITANFHPGGVRLPSLPIAGWNPGRTIENALAVFWTLFGFIADILLWVLIVFGPFALMAWGAWMLIRKVRKA
jgi:hypothetical protein